MEEDDQFIQYLTAFVRKDAIYILLIIITLGMVAYDIIYTDRIMDHCNTYWRTAWEESSCKIYQTPDPFNMTIKLTGDIIYETNYEDHRQNQDTKGPSQ